MSFDRLREKFVRRHAELRQGAVLGPGSPG
jgi:hypothetical protein